MSLPDGWRQLDASEITWPGVIAAWYGEEFFVSVSVKEDGQVEVASYDPEADFPVDLLPHIQAAWVNHQRSRAP